MLLQTSTAADAVFREEHSYEVGEKASYSLYFNWGFIWVHAGYCNFRVQDKKFNGKHVNSLSVAGVTTKTFDKMYCIRDTFETYIDPATDKPVKYFEYKHENSYISRLTYDYKYDELGADVKMRKVKRSGKVKEADLRLDTKTFDLITSCYHFRDLDNDKLEPGQMVPFNMAFDDDTYALGLKFKERTTVTLKNGEKYKALKFMPKLITGDLFKDEDDMAVYVTDDQNHIPLMVEAKIKVGYVKAMLDNVSHNKYPLTSYIGKKK